MTLTIHGVALTYLTDWKLINKDINNLVIIPCLERVDTVGGSVRWDFCLQFSNSNLGKNYKNITFTHYLDKHFLYINQLLIIHI